MDQHLYPRWRKMFDELFPKNRRGIDPLLVYKNSTPTFFRSELTVIKGSDALEPGLTRLEWLPDLPRGVEWPEHQGKAMVFLAHINLADHEAGVHPALPVRGLLYFFVGDFWSKDPIIQHRVLYFDGPVTDLVRVSPPPELKQPDQLLQETALFRCKSGFTIDPWFMDKISGGDFGSDPKFEAYFPIEEVLSEQFQQTVTRLGGYPYGFQGGGQDRYAHLYLNGFENLIQYGYFDPLPWFTKPGQQEAYLQQKYEKIVNVGKWEQFEQEVERYNQIEDDLEKHGEPIEMLFGLESEMGRCWGDAGFLEFFIRQNDLANREFGHTFCDVIST